MLATRSAQILNLSEIAKEAGISVPTVKDWLSILQSTYIIHLLQPFHNNRGKRLIKSPKLYFVDTGLLCYLLGIDSSDRMLKAAYRGHLFENMVIMDTIKRLAYLNKPYRCYYFRTASGVEIDLIIDKGEDLLAYEIKLTKTPKKAMASNLTNVLKDYSFKEAKVLNLKEQAFPLTRDIQATHWSKIDFGS